MLAVTSSFHPHEPAFAPPSTARRPGKRRRWHDLRPQAAQTTPVARATSRGPTDPSVRSGRTASPWSSLGCRPSTRDRARSSRRGPTASPWVPPRSVRLSPPAVPGRRGGRAPGGRGDQRRRAARARCSRPRGGRRRERRRRRGFSPRPTRGRQRGQACPCRSGASARGPGDEGARGSRGSPPCEISPRAHTRLAARRIRGSPGPSRRRPEIHKSVGDPGGGDSEPAPVATRSGLLRCPSEAEITTRLDLDTQGRVAYRAPLRWIVKHGYRPAGAPRKICGVCRAQTSDPSEYPTEIAWLIR